MKYFDNLPLAAFLGISLLSGGVAAVPANPIPGVFGDDLGDTGLFSHGTGALSVELAGLSEPLGFSLEFGFYFAGDPGSLFTIFSDLDSTASGDQTALIDFGAGLVVDIDESVVETDFSATPDTSIDIGFYLLVPDGGGGAVPLFTEAALNGLDVAATFPVLSDPDLFIIGFDFPGVGPLAFELVGGVTPIVPEPGMLALFAVGLGALACRRRAGNPRLG